MKERPILFSGEMVRAILDGRKTQTRRAMKPQPVLYRDCEWTYSKRGFWSHYSAMLSSDPTFFGWTTDNPLPQETINFRNPYGVPGDRLWVRETWCQVCDSEFGEEDWVDYRATPRYADPGVSHPAGWENAPDDLESLKWRPSIFMPRWASRILLEITNVRVERINDISINDVFYEGTDIIQGWDSDDVIFAKFIELWDSINAKRGYSWESNPWVWVIEFKVLESTHATN